ARREKQAREIVYSLRASVCRDDFVEVVHCAAGHYQRVGFTMPDDHLAAAIPEALEIRLVRTNYLVELPLRLAKLAFETRLRHRFPIELRVLMDPLEVRGSDRKR